VRGPVGWEQAWQEALYGPHGFYRSPVGPAGHFTTATQGLTGALLAEAFVHLAREQGLTGIVDVGAGRGELLTHLCAAGTPAEGQRAPLRLLGVDVVSRPPDLPPEVDWLPSPGGEALPHELRRLTDVLVVAHEWLDVVPCVVAEVDRETTLRERHVDPATGKESWGPPLAGRALAWAGEHWFTTTPGDRVEVGLSRDAAWADLLSRVARGVVLAVDYGHRAGARPARGTLTAYRHGREVDPVPDGRCDLTAHVAMDSLDHDELLDQRTALRALGIRGDPPDHALARTDPLAYLRALERSSAAAALTARGGFGDFLWAVKRVG
jgi:SAM-dependent MidA family methyltransferase